MSICWCIYWLQECARYEYQICNTVQTWYEYSAVWHKPRRRAVIKRVLVQPWKAVCFEASTTCVPLSLNGKSNGSTDIRYTLWHFIPESRIWPCLSYIILNLGGSAFLRWSLHVKFENRGILSNRIFFPWSGKFCFVLYATLRMTAPVSAKWRLNLTGMCVCVVCVNTTGVPSIIWKRHILASV